MEIGSAASAPQSAMAILNRTNGADPKPEPSSTTEEKDLRTKADKDEGTGRSVSTRARDDAPPSDTRDDAPPSDRDEGVGGNIDVSV